jgi:hypothetical protein
MFSDGHLDHADKRVGSLLRPLPHSIPSCVQPRSVDQPLSQSDIPSLDKLSWASGEVVFDLRLLGLCRSSIRLPSVIGLEDEGVFEIL